MLPTLTFVTLPIFNFVLYERVAFIPLSANDPEKSDDEDRDKMKTISIMQILAIPTIWFSFATFIVATACNGFLSINLEPKVNAMYIV